MTLQQLEYIVAVDEYRYFVQAAEACGVTQSTLSLMVKKLEEELDLTLFHRDTHPVEVTVTGRKVIDEAKLVLYHAKQMVELTRSEKLLASGPLRLGMISTVAPVLMSGMFKYLKLFHPDILLNAQEIRSATIVDRLKKAEIDMGIMNTNVNDKELIELPLFHERFYAYISEKEECFQLEAIDRKSLIDYPLWIMENGVQLFDKSVYKSIDEYVRHINYEGGRVGTLIQIVNENGGMTIVPETHLDFFTEQMKTRLRPIVNAVPSRVISLFMRKDYIHEKMMNIVIKAVKSCLKAEFYEPSIKGDYIKL